MGEWREGEMEMRKEIVNGTNICDGEINPLLPHIGANNKSNNNDNNDNNKNIKSTTSLPFSTEKGEADPITPTTPTSSIPTLEEEKETRTKNNIPQVVGTVE